MSMPQTPDRSNMPFASDDSIRDLIGATREWTTNHGFVNFLGNVYGMASEADNGLLVPTRYMLGTGPVSYDTVVKPELIQEVAPHAVGALGIKNNVLIQYDEAYYTAGFSFGGGPAGQSFNQPRAQFYFQPVKGQSSETGKHFIMTTQEDGTIVSTSFQLGSAAAEPGNLAQNEIKMHEQQGMLEIVQGLGAFARVKYKGHRANLW